MKVVIPSAIDLKSTQITADSNAEWSAATTYSIKQLVKVTTATPHKVYRSLRGNNLNRPPASWLEPSTESSHSTTSIVVALEIAGTPPTDISQKTITIETGKTFSAGQAVIIERISTPSSVNLLGEVVSYVSGTGVMVVKCHSVNGAGTYTEWTIRSTDEIGYWEEVEVTNQWKMFDTSVSSKTTNTGPFTVKCNVENVNYITFLGVSATSIKLELWNSNETTKWWEKTIDLVYTSNFAKTISDWWEYFFGAYEYRSEVYSDIGVLASEGVLVITFNSAVTDTITCGVCLFGRVFDIGESLYGTKPGYINYTKWTEGDDGIKTIKKGYSAKRMTVSLAVRNNTLDEVFRLLTQELKDIPTVWIGNSQYSGYESLVTFGVCKNFDPEITNKMITYATMEIEGYV